VLRSGRGDRVALFSDMDWVIIAGVAVFLLFGKENGQMLRTLGQWYGRATKLKQELLSELTKAADLSVVPGQPLSIRNTLLGIDPPPTHVSGIPAAVRAAPTAPYIPTYEPAFPWTGGYPIPTWSTTVPTGTSNGENAP
jgi:hypothetical protein